MVIVGIVEILFHTGLYQVNNQHVSPGNGLKACPFAGGMWNYHAMGQVKVILYLPGGQPNRFHF